MAMMLGQLEYVTLKVIQSCDGLGHDVLQLVAIKFSDFDVRRAFQHRAQLQLVPHINCPVADLPALKVL
ncbi:acetoacetate decarboxylase family protein, partial [Acinetobacter baumannii]